MSDKQQIEAWSKELKQTIEDYRSGNITPAMKEDIFNRITNTFLVGHSVKELPKLFKDVYPKRKTNPIKDLQEKILLEKKRNEDER